MFQYTTSSITKYFLLKLDGFVKNSISVPAYPMESVFVFLSFIPPGLHLAKRGDEADLTPVPSSGDILVEHLKGSRFNWAGGAGRMNHCSVPWGRLAFHFWTLNLERRT